LLLIQSWFRIINSSTHLNHTLIYTKYTLASLLFAFPLIFLFFLFLNLISPSNTQSHTIMSVASDIQVIRHGGRDGFESDSASSVSSVSRRRSYRRRKSFRAAKEPFKVDGKVPDVVHTLEYINQWDNSVLGSKCPSLITATSH
jgi:hypothetical protein